MQLTTQPQVILASAARVASGETSGFGCRAAQSLRIYADVTAVSGTSPTLNVTIQSSPDNSQWYTAASFSEIDATGNHTQVATFPGRYFRCAYVIGGTDTPTITFSLTKITFEG